MDSATAAVVHSRKGPRRPGERGIEVGNLDQVEPAELLLRIRMRSVQHLRLAVRPVFEGTFLTRDIADFIKPA